MQSAGRVASGGQCGSMAVLASDVGRTGVTYGFSVRYRVRVGVFGSAAPRAPRAPRAPALLHQLIEGKISRVATLLTARLGTLKLAAPADAARPVKRERGRRAMSDSENLR